MIKYGTNPKITCDHGLTLLHYAVLAEHLNLVKYLVTIGLDPEAKDNDSWTPFTMAVGRRNIDIIQYFLKQGIKDINYKYPLHRTINSWWYGRYVMEIIRLLLDYGANPELKLLSITFMNDRNF